MRPRIAGRRARCRRAAFRSRPRHAAQTHASQPLALLVARVLRGMQQGLFSRSCPAGQWIPRPLLLGKLLQLRVLGVAVASCGSGSLLNPPAFIGESLVECRWAVDMLQMLPLETRTLIPPLFFRAYDVEPQAHLLRGYATRFTFGGTVVPAARG